MTVYKILLETVQTVKTWQCVSSLETSNNFVAILQHFSPFQ